MSESLTKQLRQGLSALQQSATPSQQTLFLNYLQLLYKWNRAYNLSAVRAIEHMLSRHVLDSLSILPFLHGETILDVGSGAGLPGIPLAISLPDRQFTLIDSNGKKTRFLFQVVSELRLKNVTVVQGRVEEKVAPPQFHGIVSRAFSSINAMLGSCSQLLAPGGKIYAMKGQIAEQELSQLSAGFTVEKIQRLAVPGEVGERHVLILHKV